MKKQIMALAIALILLTGSLAACGSSNASTSQASEVVSSQQVESEASSSEAEEESTPEEIEEETEVDADVSEEASELAARLIMEDAKDLIEAPGAIMFNTPSSFDDAVKFYTDLIAEIGAKGEGVAQNAAGFNSWSWSGSYEGGTLDIVITSNEAGAGVAVSYT